MKIKAWAKTNKVGSKVELDLEVPDEDFNHHDKDRREKLIAEHVMGALWDSGLIEIGYDVGDCGAAIES